MQSLCASTFFESAKRTALCAHRDSKVCGVLPQLVLCVPAFSACMNQ